MVKGLSGLFSSNEAEKVTTQSFTFFSCKIPMIACLCWELRFSSKRVKNSDRTGQFEVENGLFCSCHVVFKLITGQPCSPQMK